MASAVVLVPEAGAREERQPHRHGRPAWLLLVLFAAGAFLVLTRGAVGAPFGNSHDGRNAGVWALGSRSLREQGPIQSRLGTRSPEAGTYANHPPLIYLETALAEVVGRSPAATRAPAWIGSLVVVILLARLLRERGMRGTAVGVAVALAVTTPMFLVYGTMLDTPVTSLPLGLGVLLLWERARQGRPVRPYVAGAVTALAVLAGWQSLLVAAAVAAWASVRLLRKPGATALDKAFVAGAVAGAAGLFGWLLWAFGGTLHPLMTQLFFRSGQGRISVSTAELISGQLSRVQGMFGLAALLGALGLVVALRDRRTRGLAAVALAVTVPYTVVFRAGASVHPYWNYWFTLPIAVGLAAGCNAMLERFVGLKVADLGVASASVVVALVGMNSAFRTNGPASGFRQGLPAAAAATGQTLPEGQQVVWYTGQFGSPASWLSLRFRLPSAPVRSADLQGVAAKVPDDLVMVGEVICADGRPTTRYGFVTAREVAAHPSRRFEHCP